ncbi:alpha/beta fold hydrolase [Nitriliruptoraceae bacterium ZYF776]|nr:alpha/beta fold hydrolase [Profundirhabdus halotolerans]
MTVPTVDVGDATISYDVLGEGTPTVLLHGGGNNHLIWWRVAPHLASERQVILPDVRGHGWSSCTADAADPARHAADLEAVLEDVGAARVHLVCHSMAGVAGLRFAVDHPDRVVSLSLIASPAVRTVRTVAGFQKVEDILRRPGAREAMACSAFAPGTAERIPEQVYLYRRLNALNPPFPRDTLMPGLRRTVVPVEDLDRFSTPTLVTAGENDQMLTFATIREVADLIPGAEFAIHEGSGHTPMVEDPGGFLDLVGSWLRRHD